MNIGINGYEAVISRFGYAKDSGLPIRVGSSEFCYQLLINIARIDSNNNYYIYLPTSPTQDMPKEKEDWNYEVFTSRKMWTLIGLTKKLAKDANKLDVFFSPTHYLPFNTGCNVISILDVSYLKFPELFTKKDLLKLKYWGKYSVGRAQKIITISESSKNDIIKAYRVKPEKVAVVYPGIKKIEASKTLNMEELKSKFGISNKYILFVGTLQPRKNISRLIHAFSKLETDKELVIVGRKGWQFDEILQAPEKYNVKDRVVFIHDAGDADLPSLYKNAEFFILPSLYEGFGLPVLEAMSYGAPVITSNVSSLPEAGGDAALYVDPEDASDIAIKMQKLLNNEDLRKDLIKKGHEQVKKFSWEKSAKEALAVLEGLNG